MKRSHLKSHFICQSHISTGDETHLFGVRLFPIFGAKKFAAFYPFDNYSHSEVDIDAFKLPYHFSTLSTHHHHSVPPSTPRILGDRGKQLSNSRPVGPFKEGDPLTIQCVATGGGTRAANEPSAKFSQSQRSPLLGPSPGWKRLLALSHLRHY